MAVLVLLVLSVAFDTVDHDFLIQRLEISFKLSDLTLDCTAPIILDPSHTRSGLLHCENELWNISTGISSGNGTVVLLFLLTTC